MSSTVLGHGDPKQMSPLQIKNNPKGKKRKPKPQSQRSRKLGKKTNKKNRNIEKERVINRNI